MAFRVESDHCIKQGDKPLASNVLGDNLLHKVEAYDGNTSLRACVQGNSLTPGGLLLLKDGALSLRNEGSTYTIEDSKGGVLLRFISVQTNGKVLK